LEKWRKAVARALEAVITEAAARIAALMVVVTREQVEIIMERGWWWSRWRKGSSCCSTTSDTSPKDKCSHAKSNQFHLLDVSRLCSSFLPPSDGCSIFAGKASKDKVVEYFVVGLSPCRFPPSLHTAERLSDKQQLFVAPCRLHVYNYSLIRNLFQATCIFHALTETHTPYSKMV
jgi:hypothetical protein